MDDQHFRDAVSKWRDVDKGCMSLNKSKCRIVVPRKGVSIHQGDIVDGGVLVPLTRVVEKLRPATDASGYPECDAQVYLSLPSGNRLKSRTGYDSPGSQETLQRIIVLQPDLSLYLGHPDGDAYPNTTSPRLRFAPKGSEHDLERPIELPVLFSYNTPKETDERYYSRTKSSPSAQRPSVYSQVSSRQNLRTTCQLHTKALELRAVAATGSTPGASRPNDHHTLLLDYQAFSNIRLRSNDGAASSTGPFDIKDVIEHKSGPDIPETSRAYPAYCPSQRARSKGATNSVLTRTICRAFQSTTARVIPLPDMCAEKPLLHPFRPGRAEIGSSSILVGQTGPVVTKIFVPNLTHIVSGSTDKDVGVWHEEMGNIQRQVEATHHPRFGRCDQDWSPFHAQFLSKLSNASELTTQPIAVYSLKEDIDLGGDVSVSSTSFVDGHLGVLWRPADEIGGLVMVKVLRTTLPTEYKETLLARFKEGEPAWAHMNHPNVLLPLGILDIQSTIAIIAPWCANGIVTEYLQGYSSIDKLSLVRDLANALAYLHAHNVVHGGLRGDNVLVDGDGRCLVSDFGQSNILRGYNADTCLSHVLDSMPLESARWTAPELVMSRLQEITPTTESDVFSFGCVVWEIYSGRLPYPKSHNDVAVVINVSSGVKPSQDEPCDASAQVWEIMKYTWVLCPNDRPTMEEIAQRL